MNSKTASPQKPLFQSMPGSVDFSNGDITADWVLTMTNEFGIAWGFVSPGNRRNTFDSISILLSSNQNPDDESAEYYTWFTMDVNNNQLSDDISFTFQGAKFANGQRPETIYGTIFCYKGGQLVARFDKQIS